MTHNIAKKAVERTSGALLAKVFPNLGKVAREAADSVFSAMLRAGSTLVADIAATLDGDATSKKGRREKVSGWLARYDFAAPVRDYLWSEGMALVGPDSVIAVDSGDISKEFGGNGMEGMEMGYDASRGTLAMGHSLLCAAVVLHRRSFPVRLSLLKGRKGLPDAEEKLFDNIVRSAGGRGILVHDRGFDRAGFVGHAIRSNHRAVVRVKDLSRDVFGTGRSIDEEMAQAPCVRTTLRSPARRAEAAVR